MRELQSATDLHALEELGRRLAQQRLDRNLTQAELARQAGVSKRTVIRLEQGESSQMTNLVRVLRALDLLGNLAALVPSPPASPIAQLESQRGRRRASRRTKKAKGGQWTWRDEREPRGDA